jgi:hypothetical protein
VTKRDEAREQFKWLIRAAGGYAFADLDDTRIRAAVDLILDAAKEEIREEADDRRWRELESMDLWSRDRPETRALRAEWRELKARLEARALRDERRACGEPGTD